MLGNLDPQTRQKLILGVMLLGAAVYFAYEYVYTPRAEAVVAMEERLERLESKNRAARRLVQNRGREAVERKLSLYRAQLDEVEGLIPSSEELPDLLDAISAEAQRTGVDLALIQPVGAEAEAFYTRRTYDLAVLGSYHQIAEFLTEIGSLPRIITPINLNVAVKESAEPGAVPRLEAKFSIETYVLPSVGTAMDTANAE